MPDWLNYTAAFSSIIGAALAFLVYLEAKEIRQSFLRRARLPELVKDLGKASKTLSKCLGDWSNDKREGITQIHVAVSLLRNVEKKVPEEERKMVRSGLAKLCKKKFFRLEAVTEATEDAAWTYYNELSSIITALEQLLKDSKWD